jgi:hypothetical protein
MAIGVEDLCNMAIRAAGLPMRIEAYYDGSPASRVALELYGQARDELLQEGDWPFCFREVALVAVPDQTPPTPWAYEYGYPTDCLRMRYIRPGPLTGGTENYDPQPVLFRPWNDNRPSPAVEAILTDTPDAVLIYNARVTDPGTWQPEFTKALVASLALKFASAFPQSVEAVKGVAVMAEQDRAEAMAVDDLSGPKMAGVMVRGQ